MPTFRESIPGGWQALMAEMAKMKEQINALKNKSFRIPVLDADPSADDPCNFWMLNDGRVRGRTADGTVMEYRPYTQQYVPTLTSDPAESTGTKLWFRETGALKGRLANGVVVTVPATGQSSGGTTNPGGTSGITKPPTVVRKTYSKIYTANASQTYDGDGSQRPGNIIYYGRYGATHGEMKAWIGFDDAAIRADLSGATVHSVQLYLANMHSYRNDGVNIRIFGDGSTSQPATAGGCLPRNSVLASVHYGKVQAKWVTLPKGFGVTLQSGFVRALFIDQPSTSISYYGYAQGVGMAAPPKLKITYTK